MKLLADLIGDDRIEEHTAEILAHILQGYWAGVQIKCGNKTAGCTLLFLNTVYQISGYIRIKEKTGKGDTLKRDIKDYMIGFGIAMALK